MVKTGEKEKEVCATCDQMARWEFTKFLFRGRVGNVATPVVCTEHLTHFQKGVHFSLFLSPEPRYQAEFCYFERTLSTQLIKLNFRLPFFY